MGQRSIIVDFVNRQRVGGRGRVQTDQEGFAINLSDGQFLHVVGFGVADVSQLGQVTVCVDFGDADRAARSAAFVIRSVDIGFAVIQRHRRQISNLAITGDVATAIITDAIDFSAKIIVARIVRIGSDDLTIGRRGRVIVDFVGRNTVVRSVTLGRDHNQITIRQGHQFDRIGRARFGAVGIVDIVGHGRGEILVRVAADFGGCVVTIDDVIALAANDSVIAFGGIDQLEHFYVVD